MVPGPSCELGPTNTTRPFVLIYAHQYYQALRANTRPQILPGPSCCLGPPTSPEASEAAKGFQRLREASRGLGRPREASGGLERPRETSRYLEGLQRTPRALVSFQREKSRAAAVHLYDFRNFLVFSDFSRLKKTLDFSFVLPRV